MVIKDENGKVLGSIEFSKEELELDNEKFAKIAELGNRMFDNERLKKEENTKRLDKITSTLSNTLHEVTDLVKDFNKCEIYDPKETKKNIDSSSVKGKSINIDLDLS